MRLNTLKPAVGAKTKKIRIGRGLGSGFGKTCGYGHKGQKARSGYGRKTGFEGGQMPYQRRVPKFGFTPINTNGHVEVQLHDLNKIGSAKIDLVELKKAGLVKSNVTSVKVILNGSIDKAVTLAGIKSTAGARVAIEKAGGKIDYP